MLGGASINRVWALGWILATGAGSVFADGIVSCNINGQPFNSTLTAMSTITGNATYSAGCATQGSFAYNDLLDWGVGLGYATQAPHDPTVSGAWTTTTPNGVGVAIDITPGYQGNNYQLMRVDNAQYVWTGSGWSYVRFAGYPGLQTQQYIAGHFDGPSNADTTDGGGNPSAPSVAGLGEHLLAATNGWGPITITFNTGIEGIGFLIASTSMSFTDATIQAWASANPNPSFDTPLQTYAILDTGGGGTCAGLQSNTNPQPCKDAPFVAVSVQPGSSLIRAVTISVPTTVNGNPYSQGFAIDSLQLQEVPEPAVPLLTGSALALLAFLLHRKQRKQAVKLQSAGVPDSRAQWYTS